MKAIANNILDQYEKMITKIFSFTGIVSDFKIFKMPRWIRKGWWTVLKNKVRPRREGPTFTRGKFAFIFDYFMEFSGCFVLT